MPAREPLADKAATGHLDTRHPAARATTLPMHCEMMPVHQLLRVKYNNKVTP